MCTYQILQCPTYILLDGILPYTHATFHAVPPYGFFQKACPFFLNGDIYFRNFMVGGHPQGMKESPQKKWLCSVKPLLSDAQASE